MCFGKHLLLRSAKGYMTRKVYLMNSMKGCRCEDLSCTSSKGDHCRGAWQAVEGNGQGDKEGKETAEKGLIAKKRAMSSARGGIALIVYTVLFSKACGFALTSYCITVSYSVFDIIMWSAFTESFFTICSTVLACLGQLLVNKVIWSCPKSNK